MLQWAKHSFNEHAFKHIDAEEEGLKEVEDLMESQNKDDAEINRLKALLKQDPTDCDALTRLIEFLRRGWRFEECREMIELSEGSGSAQFNPGLHYAKGLYYWYCNKLREAIDELYLGRGPRGSPSNPWSERCTVTMIRVHLDLDSNVFWWDHNYLTDGYSDGHNHATERGGRHGFGDVEAHIGEAEKLLADVADGPTKALLQAYALAVSKRKEDMKKAPRAFHDALVLANGGSGSPRDQPNIPCLVGTGTALLMLHETPAAGIHLKQLPNLECPEVHATGPEDADDFERGLLLLAGLHLREAMPVIGDGKLAQAKGLIFRVLQANLSCGRAWELLGIIYDKKKCWQAAAKCHSNAWALWNESDPEMGAKLADSHLKAGAYKDAVAVAEKVLAQYPDYNKATKLRKDVLEKARAKL
mmetsp:Transcript_66993/g.112365  ORF Transcript_66993/g.112365 Transcript_66993/m.112365 type:complete len:416 (+) Transcript_66993:43-1290(+)